MTFSGLFDVIISLVFMYLLLSLICSTIVELISTALSWRSKALKASIAKLIDDPEILKKFYCHGLIAEDKVAASGGNTTAPSSGASDSTEPAPSPENKPKSASSAADSEPTAPNNAPKSDVLTASHPSYIDGKTFAMALLSVATGANTTTIPSIRQTVEKMNNSKIKDVLLANIDAGVNNLTELHKELGVWFDTTMDRLSGNYKRSIKNLTLFVALIVTIVFNADTLLVGHTLWNDETLRSQIVDAATQIVKKNSEKKPSAGTSNNNSAGTSNNNIEECLPTPLHPEEQVGCLFKRFKGEQDQLRPFPIGWSSERAAELFSGGLNSILAKILGILFTTLALSLGAPFWFDLLDKCMTVRGTGPKPARTEDHTV